MQTNLGKAYPVCSNFTSSATIARIFSPRIFYRRHLLTTLLAVLIAVRAAAGAPPTPVVSAGGATTFCQGSSVVLTAASTGATSFQWYLDGTAIAGANAQTYPASAAGTYTVTATNAGGTSSQSGGTVVKVNPNPPAPTVTAGGNTSFCSGGSVQLTANASGASTYQWSMNGSAVNGASGSTYTATNAGNYTVSITGSNGCGSPSSSAVSVSILPTPAAPAVAAAGPTTFCAPGSVILSATASGAGSYQWSLNGSPVSGANANALTATSSGNYTVTTMNSAGCTSPASASVTVTVNQPPAAPSLSAGGPTTFCTGGSVALSATATGASSYKWFLNGSVLGSVTGTTDNATSAGSYKVSITDANGCTSPLSSGVTVSINPAPATPTITAGGNTPLCAGQSVLLTANGPGAATYQWYQGGTALGGATGLTYSAAATGSYTVSITDANGCASAQSAATPVTIVPTPTAPSITAGGPTTFCSGGSVLLTAGASGAVAYQWYQNGVLINGVTTNTYTANAAGNYSVSYTNSNGCVSTVSPVTTVTVSTPPPAATISAGGPLSFCTPGSVTLSAQGATGALSYQWFVNSTPIVNSNSATLSVSTSGNYTVSYSNGCSSTVSAGTAVTVYTPLTGVSITAGGPTTFCQGTGVLLTAATNDAEIYQWYVNGAPIPGAIAQTYFATSPGSYTVMVENPCSSGVTSAPVTLTMNPAPATPTASAAGPVTFCAPGSVVLSASPAGAPAYQWFQDGYAITGATTQTYTATATGNYTVTTVSNLGCSSSPSQPILVTAYPPLSTPPVISSGPTTFCAGGSTTLTANIGGATNFQWYLNNTAIPGATAQSYVATASGSYTVFVSNPCSSATSGPLIVTVNPAPPIPTLSASGPTSFCSGSSVTLTASAPGATAYQWANNDTVMAGITNQTYTTDSSGSYTVTVANAYGCTSTSAPQQVTVFPQLAPLNISVSPSGPTSFCAGGSVTLNATASGATSYQWFQNGIALPAATTTSYTATASGTYTLTISNPCSTITSTPVTVTVNPLPATPAITASGSTNLCAGDSVILQANASGALSYQWYLGAAPIAGETTSADTAKTAGSYTVTVSDANGCVSPASAATTVVVNPTPAAPTVTAGGPVTFCQGNSVVLTASPAGASSYQWFLGASAINGATGSSYAGSLAGAYTVTLTDANGCTSPASAQTTVTVNPNPQAATVTAATTTTFCSGDSVVLTATVTGAVSYQWQLNGTPITGATTSADTAKISGSYTITITDANGCTSTASTGISVAADPTPTTPLLSAGGPTIFCAGGNVILSANAAGGSTYQWYQGSTLIAGASSNSYSADSSGTYTVKVTDANGCTSLASTSTQITANPVPDSPSVSASGPLGICPGQSLQLTATPVGGSAYQWYLDGASIPGATNQTYTATTAGTYTVTMNNSMSCTSNLSAATSISNPCLPKADLSLLKTVTPGPYSVNKPVTYSLLVTNNGPDSAQNVVITDTLPQGLGDPVNFGGPAPSYSATDRVLQWNIPEMAPGAVVTLTFDVSLKSFGTFINTGYVGSNTLDPDTSNNHSSAALTFAGDLFIPNVITPNGDGKNDYFFIVGLNQYPGSALRIYNRWGSEVYQTQNYVNDWQGNGLNAGTYYYVLIVKTPTGQQSYKGWVEIIR